jgi:flagellin
MDSQIRGMAVATRNANDAISFSQTTSGALTQISNNLQRMRELAVQAANGSNSASDTSLLNQEFSQLQTEVSRIQGSTTFNNVSVFTASDTVFQIGANTTSNDRVNMQGTALTSTMSLGTQTITDRGTTSAGGDISASLVAASAISGASVSSLQNAAIDAINSSQKISFAVKNDLLTQVNTSAAVGGQTLAGLYTALVTTAATNIVGATGGIDATPVGTAATAASGQSLALSAITALDNALTEVNTASAVQGALQNRFSAVISNLTAFSQSQTAAKSRIVDADFAAETAKLSKSQILQQAGTAMLAQANQLPSSVLSLLK